MPAYDSTLFTPPAPLAHVSLRNPETGATRTEVPMLLVTGADVTRLPRAVVDDLGIESAAENRYMLVGIEGHASLASVVSLEMISSVLLFAVSFCW